MYWTIAASIMLVLCGLLALGACWVSARGVGGMSTLRIAVKECEAGLERIDERITREVKARAGNIAAAKAEEERTILEQAAQHLQAQHTVVPIGTRPSPLRRRR